MIRLPKIGWQCHHSTLPTSLRISSEHRCAAVLRLGCARVADPARQVAGWLSDSSCVRLQQAEARTAARSFLRLRNPSDLDAVGLGGRPISLDLADRQLVLPQPEVLRIPAARSFRSSAAFRTLATRWVRTAARLSGIVRIIELRGWRHEWKQERFNSDYACTANRRLASAQSM
ncbi:hypothetical protein Pan97_15470 [Bremerella volcania]|uniref:Uncharacterized protein n=1 Tax=Bremerella volcania TaxID=2527984 RepID=A0A518C5N6_9BACT|nr:hypothetical protein Pan97_15470 [Bremerella volcania]